MKEIQNILERIKSNLDSVIIDISLPFPNVVKIKTNHSRALDEILKAMGPALIHGNGYTYNINKEMTETKGCKDYRLLILPEDLNEGRAISATHDFIMHLSRAAHNYAHTHKKP